MGEKDNGLGQSYDLETSKAIVFQVLKYDKKSFLDEIHKRRKWLEEHSSDGTSQKDILSVLITDNINQTIMKIDTVEDADVLEKLVQNIWEAYESLLETYHVILNELCIKKYTWKYLRVKKYLSNRRIKQLKEEALEAIVSMLDKSVV